MIPLGLGFATTIWQGAIDIMATPVGQLAAFIIAVVLVVTFLSRMLEVDYDVDEGGLDFDYLDDDEFSTDEYDD